MDFSAGAGMGTSNDAIPNGQLAWAIINVHGVKPSKSGGEYVDIELTLDDNQPFARKKVWTMIGNPFHQGNSEKYREMGMIAITRILEAGRGAGPNNKAAYALQDFSQLSGLRVPVKIKLVPPADGYNEKNEISDWLTPNPAGGSGHKGYLSLMAGQYNSTPAPVVAQSGFGAPPAAMSVSQGFGAPPANQGFGGQPAAQPGFSQQPQQGFGAPSVTGQPAVNTGFATTTAVTAQSPSDPNASPGWLAQANAG